MFFFPTQSPTILFRTSYGEFNVSIKLKSLKVKAKRLQVVGERIIARMGFRDLIEAITLIYPHCINMEHFGSLGTFFSNLLSGKKNIGNLIVSRTPEIPGPPRRNITSCGFKTSACSPWPAGFIRQHLISAASHYTELMNVYTGLTSESVSFPRLTGLTHIQ